MPRVRRRAHARRGTLTNEHWQELILGPKESGKSLFASDAERKAVWMEYAWELTSEWTPGAVLWGEDMYGMPRKPRR
jgi:hypothetical protein